MHRFTRILSNATSSALYRSPTLSAPTSKAVFNASKTCNIIQPRHSGTVTTHEPPIAPAIESETTGTQLSTALALPLAGGDTTRSIRAETHETVLTAFSEALRINPHPHAKFNPRDVVTTTNVVFVGVGLESNWPGLLKALDHYAFGNRHVVVIRDVFDRNEERRQTLSDWFSIIADDVAAMDECIMSRRKLSTLQRFVNVYSPYNNGYKLERNDIDFIEYLHSTGWRVIPVSSPKQLCDLRDGHIPIPLQQSTNHVLACAPTAFSFNEKAATDNHFMNNDDVIQNNNNVVLRRQVLDEFANLHYALTDKLNGVGARVHLFTHEDWHNTPDACFPNNTFSTHTNLEANSESCILVLYPMKDKTRRKERRLVQRLLTRGRYTQIYDMTREEVNGAFLEGTGSLVLDRVNRLAYIALSQRSDLKLAQSWASLMNYTLIPFTSVDKLGRPIYHTNVMMTIGSRVAIVCTESIADERERNLVVGNLKDTGHEIVDISFDQVEQFCGNVIELESFYGEQMFIMSTGAHQGFTEQQRDAMLDGGVSRLVHADISTIQKVGGGGVRCTIAELF